MYNTQNHFTTIHFDPEDIHLKSFRQIKIITPKLHYLILL